MLSPIDPRFPHGSQLRGNKLFRLLLAGALLPDANAALAATFTVNTTADVPAASANGVCETATGNGVCSLRAAIQGANALFGVDTIVLQPNVVYQLTRAGGDDTALNGDLDILDSVTIAGAGPGSTIIDGNSGVTGDRVFQVFRCINNTTATDGNCMFGNVVAEISGVTIEHGSSPNSGGGGIFNSGVLTLASCAIANNTGNGAPADGGGIHNEGALTLTNSAVLNNTTGNANGQGGGIWTAGNLTITGSTISGNTTLGRGGGIFIGLSGAQHTINGSTITGNMGQSGGGIYNSAYLVAINSTISSNASSASGGGIVAGGTHTTGLYNVTVANNIANFSGNGSGVGGGVSGGGLSTLNFKNSIIAGNGYAMSSGGPLNFLISDDCEGEMTAEGNNIMSAVDSNHCTVNGAFTLADDPGLGPLQDNGGSTQTHALLNRSPAIDGVVIGDCTDDLGAILSTDQRGFSASRGCPLRYRRL